MVESTRRPLEAKPPLEAIRLPCFFYQKSLGIRVSLHGIHTPLEVLMTTTTSRRATPIDSLPFVGPRPHRGKDQLRRCFWHNVASTGDYTKDNELGVQYAYLALQAIKDDNFTPLLGWIALDMIRTKCPDGIAIGFFQIIADAAIGRSRAPTANLHIVPAVQS